jgi:predicted regulator of Ras-like GTPase activity (Roadblock/LC7/MglB family)
MEAILKKINSVIGVTGSFVCLNDGSIAACALPDAFDAVRVALAVRVVSQTFRALDTSGQRVAEADLTFGQGRLILKNLRNGVLVILCARTINLPLLNLTANVAAKKLTEELKLAKALPIEPVVAPAPAPTPVLAAPPLSRTTESTLFAELEREWQQIMSEAGKSQTTLRVLSALATWLCCPQSCALLAPPEKKQIDFAARATQRDSIRRVLERLGYQTNQSLDELYSSPRFYFSSLARGVEAVIYLDAFDMYHHLDLAPFLAQEGSTLSETALLLLRLQLVEMTESGLRELCALLLDHDLSMGVEKRSLTFRRLRAPARSTGVGTKL